IGIDEDPVTGSIHTAVAPLWAERLGKQELVAYQASTRGGTLYCRILDDQRIEISGYAVLYMQSDITLDDAQHT
ncbi:MAG: PhzF family phenazine biosynthesis protein, partial [Acinetobacter sp.]